MRPIFRDPEMEKDLLNRGFTVVPGMLTNEEVQVCLNVYKNADPGILKYTTLDVDDYNQRKQVFVALDGLLTDKIKSYFNNYKTIGYNFAVKKAGSEQIFDAHLDDIYADEKLYTSVNVWFPLVDVDDVNGGLYMVENSHKLPQPVRGQGVPFAFAKFMKEIDEKKQILHLKAGDGLFFHYKMIHGSTVNKSGADRPAIITGFIPEEAQPIVYVRHEELRENEMELFECPIEMLLKLDWHKRPVGFKSYGIYKFTTSDISREEFLKILA